MPLTMVSFCCLALPVRGRLETILIVLGSDVPRPNNAAPASTEATINTRAMGGMART